MANDFDVIVIGAGPAGYHAAIRSSQLGLKTAIVEKWLDSSGKAAYGGTCLNVGCIPSKALLEASHKYVEARDEFGDLGIKISKPSADIPAMMKRKNRVVADLTLGVAGLLKTNNVKQYEGVAKVLGNGEVNITLHNSKKAKLNAENIIIATGSVPIDIKPCPLTDDLIVDSSGALEFDSVPKKIGVIGSGIIGLELGSVWSRLGSDVVLLEALEDLLPVCDFQVSKEAAKEFKKQGMDIRLGARVTGSQIKNGKVEISYSSGDKEQTEIFDKVIVAVGRRPYSNDLFSPEAGVALDERGFIAVNEYCMTAAPGIYAVGDVVRGPMLAHKGMEEGIMVAERIAGKLPQVNYDLVPSVVYTHPEIAWVGKSEEDLKGAGEDYSVGVFPMRASGRAIASNNTSGLIKVLADKHTDQILGVHIIASHASEMIAEAVIAMEYKASAEDLGLTMFAHPTLSEGLHEAALAVSGHAIHVSNRKK
ncbi:MAG: dihydrolipoyl dehydrogenase [Gammaproteobacteria bacterium]|nr:dihydrolipoyl dehydrogenase [Gammaproteobacteria bacterium]|tara:strand:+ start:275 stop:1708 length:1434 start_codon:yes stop_codon:yes gene_type:complete